MSLGTEASILAHLLHSINNTNTDTALGAGNEAVRNTWSVPPKTDESQGDWFHYGAHHAAFHITVLLTVQVKKTEI